MVQVDKPDLTKSSAFSLESITTAITEKISTMKMVVVKVLRNMYRSRILNIYRRKCSDSGVVKLLNSIAHISPPQAILFLYFPHSKTIVYEICRFFLFVCHYAGNRGPLGSDQSQHGQHLP